jgi:hypothetical protein
MILKFQQSQGNKDEALRIIQSLRLYERDITYYMVRLWSHLLINCFISLSMGEEWD